MKFIVVKRVDEIEKLYYCEIYLFSVVVYISHGKTN